MEGNLAGSDEKNIKGETSFRWLPGGGSKVTPSQSPCRTVSWMRPSAANGVRTARFSGGWRPNPDADDTVNVPYDIGGHQL
jgi:hypothetical protein